MWGIRVGRWRFGIGGLGMGRVSFLCGGDLIEAPASAGVTGFVGVTGEGVILA
jgi:hypothetical protein